MWLAPRYQVSPLSIVIIGATSGTLSLLEDQLAADALPFVARCEDAMPHDVQPPADLLVVDCARWRGDPCAAVRHLREQWASSTIVCIGTATEQLAAAALMSGADIALHAGTQPSYVAAVLRATARRTHERRAQMRVAFGDIVYDREAGRVWAAGEEVALTRRELRLFDCLFMHAGAPVSVATLERSVWHHASTGCSNPLQVYVRYLRRKLAGSRSVTVVTVRGHGYQLMTRPRHDEAAHDTTDIECDVIALRERHHDV